MSRKGRTHLNSHRKFDDCYRTAELELKELSEGASPFAPERTPRLNILHLMLWTLYSAVYLPLNRVILTLQNDLPEEHLDIQRTSSVCQGVISGAALARVIVLVHTHVRGVTPMLRQPGRWLLFVYAALTLVVVPLLLVFQVLEMVIFFRPSSLMIHSLAFLFLGIAYVLAVRRSAGFRWKAFFIALAVFAILRSLYYLGMWFGPAFGILNSIPT